MSTDHFPWLRAALAAVFVAVTTMCVSCGGPDFTRATADGGAARADGGPDADLSPIIVYRGDADTEDGGESGATDNPETSADTGVGLICNTSLVPKDDPCVVANAYGVFVSTTGLDTGSGTQADPLKTITEGLARAAQDNKSRVFICKGTYSEQVVLDGTHDGVSLYGGFDCTGIWTWTGSKAQVSAPIALYALRVQGTTKAIAVEDLAFSVTDATGQDSMGNGNSSIAAFVSGAAAGVNFARVQLHAGAGADGGAGAPPPTNWYSADAGDLNGNNVRLAVISAAKDCRCKVWGDTLGGGAGDLSNDGQPGTASPAATPDLLHGLDGAGGLSWSASRTPSNCTPGDPGANGAPGTRAGQGAQVLGAAGAGWGPARGTDGFPGNPGQGGGGGGHGQSVSATGGGGGGACGGCGGAGGLGGGGGGASIAVLVYDAGVSMKASQLITSLAGQGGPGGTGEPGAIGGGGGQGSTNPTYPGCSGGSGGNGAGGGGGGGGAGGISIGILSNKVGSVTVDGATAYALGAAGSGGSAGTGGGGGGVGAQFPAAAGRAGGKGVDGVSQALLAL